MIEETLIGGALTALGGIITTLMSYIHEGKKTKSSILLDNNKFIRDNKINAYLETLEVLTELRKKFDNTCKNNIIHNTEKELDEYNELSMKSIKVSALIRLYASDEILDIYLELCRYTQSTKNNYNLATNSKERYVELLNKLGKKMNEDINKYNKI